MKIFLGGTCAQTTWRDDLSRVLNDTIDVFNPVVKDWTPECQLTEIREKLKCEVHLYVITSEMKGVFSIAEAVDSVHTTNKTTILHVIPTGFDSGQLKSLFACVDLIKQRGGIAYVDPDLRRTARVLNSAFS